MTAETPIERFNKLRQDISLSKAQFEIHLRKGMDLESTHGLNLSDYEERINLALELQYIASSILGLYYNLNAYLSKIVKAGLYKNTVEIREVKTEIDACIDVYKNHVYTFTTRAKVLSDLLKVKQMANPDVVWRS